MDDSSQTNERRKYKVSQPIIRPYGNGILTCNYTDLKVGG